MASTFQVPSQSYPIGPQAIGPFTIPAGNTRIQVTCTHGTWPLTNNDLVLQATFEVSFDNGVNWQELTSVGWGGGTLPVDKFGNPQPANVLTTSIVSPCQLRGTVNVFQSLTTAITVALT